jgi:hypothetical protein
MQMDGEFKMLTYPEYKRLTKRTKV